MELDSYEKFPERTIKSIVAGESLEPEPPMDGQYEFWSQLLETPSKPDKRSVEPEEVFWQTANPLTPQEFEQQLKKLKKGANGMDGIDKGILKLLPKAELLAWFNIFFYKQHLPASLKEGRTSLIRKIPEPKSPADYRPVTMSSIIVRLYHAILAERLSLIPIPFAQKGFQRFDGCSQQVWSMKGLLKDRQARCQPVHIAMCDVRKAFDTVSHDSMMVACKYVGVPPPFLGYLKHAHAGLVTTLSCDPLARKIRVGRGVKQGDSVSVHIFNFCMALATSSLPSGIGIRLAEALIVRLGQLADDTWLAATTVRGLRALFEEFCRSLGLLGMELNPSKSATISINVNPQRKHWFVGSDSILSRDGIEIKAIDQRGYYKYLGVKLGPEGLGTTIDPEDLKTALDRLASCALRPQHLLYGLRTVIIPGVYYALTLGDHAPGVWRRMDRIVRGFTRRVLHLPHDTVTPYYHASHVDGGLGIPSIYTQVTRLRRDRFRALRRSKDPFLKYLLETDYMQLEERLLEKPARVINQKKPDLTWEITPSAEENKVRWAAALYETIDGKGLRHHAEEQVTVGGYRSFWVIDKASKLSGREFVEAIHARGAVLATKARRARGSTATRYCATCPRQVANLGHLVQTCPRMHDLRIVRHNEVCKLLESSLVKHGYTVIREPRIPSGNSYLKPDLLCFHKHSAEWALLDPIISSDRANLEDYRRRKIEKYGTPEVLDWCRNLIAAELGVDQVHNDPVISGVVLDWRGAWSARSWSAVRSLNVPKEICELVSIRVLRGACSMQRLVERSTAR